MREQARVADRLAEPLEHERRRLRLPLRPDAARHRHEDGLPQARPLRLAATPAGSASRIRCTPSFFVAEALELLRPDARPIARRSRRSRRSTAGLPGRAGRAGDPPAPGALRRPAHGEAADRARRRAPAPDRRGDHDDRLGLDRAALGPAALLPAERRRLGRHALARHGDVPRPLDRRAADPPGPQARSRRKGEEAVDGRRRRARAGARVLATTRRSSDATHAALLQLRARARSRTPARPTGSRSSTRCSSRTRSAS